MIPNESQNTTPEIKAEAGKFIEKAYRDASVREAVRIGVPHQIRAIRQQRGWSQRELGEKASKPQNVISRLEDPSYGKLSLQTLFELASAFDVALLVKFVPFSRFRQEFRQLTPENLGVLGFEEDLAQALNQKSEYDRMLKGLQDQCDKLIASLNSEPQHELASRALPPPESTISDIAPKSPSPQLPVGVGQLRLFPQPSSSLRPTTPREWRMRSRRLRMRGRSSIRPSRTQRKKEGLHGTRTGTVGIAGW